MIPFPEFGQLAQEVGAILQQFYQLEQSVATANQQQTIFTATLQTESMVQQIIDIVRQIQADTQYIRAALGIVDNRLLQAVGTPQQANTPVTLPPTPPPAYGVDNSAVALAVWQFQPVDAGRYPESQDVVAKLDNFLNALKSDYVLPVSQGDLFVADANFNPHAAFPFSHLPFVDTSTILPTDPDVATWLNREEFFYSTWAMDGTTGLAVVTDPTAAAHYYCTVNKEQFAWYKREVAGKNLTTVAPVWPGLAGVSLGTSHAISAPGETITGACDGVIIDITGVPSWAGNFTFGTAISWRNIGGLSFTNDNGEEEFPQVWGFEHVIYLPKSMAHASGYVYRAALGVSGTITPFTIN